MDSDLNRRKECFYSAISALFILLVFDIILTNYSAALVPLYGSVPSTLHLLAAYRASVLAATTAPAVIAFQIVRRLHCISPFLLLLPQFTHWMTTITGRMKSPFWGPAIVHGVVLLPFAFTLVVAATVHVSDQLLLLDRADESLSLFITLRFVVAYSDVVILC